MKRPGPAPPSLPRSGSAGGRRIAATGFTLIELLVVLAILGLAASAALLAFPDPGGSVINEAERFAARAKAARDSALLEARPTGIDVSDGGYSYIRRERGEWRNLARYEWSEGTRPEIAAGGQSRTVFDPTGLTEPMQLILRRGESSAAIEIAHDGRIQIRR